MMEQRRGRIDLPRLAQRRREVVCRRGLEGRLPVRWMARAPGAAARPRPPGPGPAAPSPSDPKRTRRASRRPSAPRAPATTARGPRPSPPRPCPWRGARAARPARGTPHRAPARRSRWPGAGRGRASGAARAAPRRRPRAVQRRRRVAQLRLRPLRIAWLLSRQSEGLVLVPNLRTTCAYWHTRATSTWSSSKAARLRSSVCQTRDAFIFTERREAPPQPPRAAARRVLRPQSSFDRGEGPAVERQRLRRPTVARENSAARHGLVVCKWSWPSSSASTRTSLRKVSSVSRSSCFSHLDRHVIQYIAGAAHGDLARCSSPKHAPGRPRPWLGSPALGPNHRS